MHDALDIERAVRHRPGRSPVAAIVARRRARRLFMREAFDDWEVAHHEGRQLA